MTGSAANDAARLRLLYELGGAFAARLDLGELTALVLQRCRDVFQAEAAAVLLHDPQRDELYFPYAAGEDPEVNRRLTSVRFPAGRGIAGQVLRSGTPARIDDAASDPRFYGGVDQRTGLITRNLLCAPLHSRQGAIGVIQVVNRRGGARFAEEDLRFLDALAGSIAVAIENARFYAQLKEQVAALERAVHEHNQLIALRRELDLAREIQQSILPRVFPPFPGRRDFDLYAAMVPALEVGGDFYDFFLVDEHRLALVIGDVSGKGVAAALFMAMSRTLLKSVALTGVAPGECLQRVNRLLCADNSSEMFVSLFYGLLDARSGELAYSNGGHNLPVLMRSSGAVEMLPRTGGAVLAALPDGAYAPATATLQRGDGLFLYTDGVTEAMNAAGAMFGDGRLLALLAAQTAAAPESVVQRIVHEVRRHAGGAAQSDDVTALMVRFHG
jgi:sigma-B regulation protein RsbU (phosphoserine phosphatase)